MKIVWRFCFVLTGLGLLTACQAPSPESSAYVAASGSARAEAAEDRPGLATAWGETIDSPVSTTGFQRASKRPTAVAKIFYNDRSGIEQLTKNQAQRQRSSTISLGNLGHVRIETPGGRAYPIWRWRNDYYVEGKKGDRYVIEAENRSAAPLEIVASVDGLDVLDGKTATYSKRGYQIDPGDTVRIKGFRRSTGAVAAFRFSTVDDSYAQRKYGDSRNVGVIGVAAFHERGSDPDSRLRRNADPFPGESGFATAP